MMEHPETIKNIEAIFWDFDGVLLNSNSARDLGFLEVLSEFPEEQVNQLMEFHHANGGLSRYVKFRYFFEKIREETLTDVDLVKWTTRFSEIMKSILVNPELLIEETLAYVRKHHTVIPMHIVSGSDQSELRYLCKELKIDSYFVSIHGSPKPKLEWVSEILRIYKYTPQSCILIGDSINDFEAASQNHIDFVAFNNREINHLSSIPFNF